MTYDPTFDGWINQAASGARQNLRKTIVVELLDQDGHVDTRWRFRNAWPSKFRVAPVKVGGNTAVAELVTIEHEGFERESVVDIHFKFHVTIEGVQVGAFSDASGLSAEGNEITERRSNERKLGGLPKYPNIVLKRGYTQDRSLWNWYRNTIAGQSDDRRRVTITLMNEALQPVQRWHAEHAWVTKYDPTSLDADPNNIAVDTIEIAHEGITIEPDDKV